MLPLMRPDKSVMTFGQISTIRADCRRPLRVAKWRIRNIYSRSMDTPKRIFTLMKAANIRSIGAYGASTPQGQPFATPDFSLLEHTNAGRSFCPF